MGYVYLIKSDESGYYKIGYSANPNNRIKQLQTGSADRLRIVHLYESVRARKVEKSLHYAFSHARINNEWFELPLEDELKFLDLCKQIDNNILLIENF